jgi:hypothetical protein
MSAARHHWRMSARGDADGKCLFFGCPCGFSVLQASGAEAFHEPFIRAVNDHLRQIALENTERPGAHLKLARG